MDFIDVFFKDFNACKCFALLIRQVLPITELLQTQLKLLFVNL
jgi:hypothetical protein